MTFILKIGYKLTKNGCRFDNQQLYVGLFNEQSEYILKPSLDDLKRVIRETCLLSNSCVIYDITTEFVDITGRVADLYIVDFTTRIFVGDDDYESNMSHALISDYECTADQTMVCCVDEDDNTTTSVKNIIKPSILNAGRKDKEVFVRVFGGDDYVVPLKEYFYK